MTTETSGESQAPSESNTNPDGAADTSQNSTVPSQESQPPAAEIPPNDAAAPKSEVPADAPGNAAKDGDGGADDGKPADLWATAELDEETRKFVGDKTPAQVAKELQNAQKLLGKKSIGVPGKDSTPEEQRAFHKARGVPDDEKGYDLAPAIDALKAKAPDGWAPSPELEASFRKAARLSNMSQSEATEFAQHWLGEQFEQRKGFVDKQLGATKEAKAMLSAHTGPDRASFDANFARGMQSLGIDGASIDVFVDAFGGDGKARFAMAKAVAEIGRGFAEGGPVPGGGVQPGATTMTKEQARQEMNRIRTDPVLSVAYNDVNNPRFKEVEAEMTRLGKIERGVS